MEYDIANSNRTIQVCGQGVSADPCYESVKDASVKHFDFCEYNANENQTRAQTDQQCNEHQAEPKQRASTITTTIYIYIHICKHK